jgi:hypothetical protein
VWARRLVHGLVTGVLIALPVAIVLPLIAWARINARVGPLLLALPILFVGARAKLVVTESALGRPATDKATTIINESGGDMIQTPKPGE